MINVVVEGESDREAARAVVREAGGVVGVLRVSKGKSRLDPLIPKYNEAAARSPWVVFRDTDGECPVALRSRLSATISRPRASFALRLAHTMSEAWLLADQDAFADYFGVRRGRVPTEPASLQHAKRALILLCRTSRTRAIRLAMTSGADQIGPEYVATINNYAATARRPAVAARSSDSLNRAVRSIRALSIT